MAEMSKVGAMRCVDKLTCQISETRSNQVENLLNRATQCSVTDRFATFPLVCLVAEGFQPKVEAPVKGWRFRFICV